MATIHNFPSSGDKYVVTFETRHVDFLCDYDDSGCSSEFETDDELQLILRDLNYSNIHNIKICKVLRVVKKALTPPIERMEVRLPATYCQDCEARGLNMGKISFRHQTKDWLILIDTVAAIALREDARRYITGQVPAPPVGVSPKMFRFKARMAAATITNELVLLGIEDGEGQRLRHGA